MDFKQVNSTSFNSQRSDGWLPVVNQPGRAVGVLFGVFFVMLILVSIVSTLIIGEDGLSVKGMRIFTIIQDLLVFIMPAILAAFVATRLPASLLTISTKPRISQVLLAIVVMMTSMPAMEWIVELNSNLHLPEALSGLEEVLRGMEDSASSAVDGLFSGNTVGDLIVGILIVGVLTGIAEELFFRGALQNLFMSMPNVKKHFAIWAVAFIFSFMHFQFFGFLPRLLLGAYFGYLLWWSGSVWLPIIVHAFNNSLVVLVSWFAVYENAGEAVEDAASLNLGMDWVTISLSIIVTALGLIILRRRALRQRATSL